MLNSQGANEGTAHVRRVNAALAEAKRELERMIAAGATSAVEAVIAHHSLLVEYQEAMLELVYFEYVLLQELGIAPSAESYMARFPQLWDDIERILEVDQAINDAQSFSTPVARQLDTHGAPTTSAGLAHNQIPGYEILEIIGRGGMGLVFKAKQSRLNRLVAIKTIDVLSSFNPKIVRRFRTEAELAASLQHPNIVQIHEIGTNDEVPYFSMEFVTGGSLQSVLADQTLRPIVAARLVETLAYAVHYAHEHGVIHRDLKPANILLAPSSRAESLKGLDSKRPTHAFEPKIADFGLAKHLASELQQTQTGDMIGTPAYMAPEQIAGTDAKAGPACDVYALGVILYHALIGRPPFEGATPIETLDMVRSTDPIRPTSLRAGIPRDLETICLTCLQKDPKRRYASADMLANDLNRYLNSKPIRARPTSPLRAAAKWVSRHRSLTLTLMTLLLAAIGSTILWWRSESHRRQAEFNGEKASASASSERQQRERAEAIAYTQKIATARLEYSANNFSNCRAVLDSCDPTLRNFEWGYLYNLTHNATWDSPPMPIPVSSVTMSPNGDLVAAAYGDLLAKNKPQLRIWDTRSDKDPIELEHHQACIHDLSFSHDGAWLVSAGGWTDPDSIRNGKTDGVVIWDIKNQTKRLVIEGINATVARFTPDKPTLIVGRSDGMLDEYSVATGEILREYKSHTKAVKDLAFGPGQRMATAAEDGRLCLWDRALKQSTPYNFLTSLGKLSSTAWSPDGKKLFVAGADGKMKNFDIRDQRIVLMDMYVEDGSTRIALSPDGQYLASAVGGSATSLQLAKTGERIRRYPGHNANVTDLAFDGLGDRLCLGGVDGSVSVWEQDHKRDSGFRAERGIKGIRTIASHPSRNIVVMGLDSVPEQNEVIMGALLLGPLGLDVAEARSTLPPKSRIFVAGALDGIWMCSLSGETDRPNSLAFSNSGRLVVAGCEDGRMHIWEIDDSSLNKPQVSLDSILSVTLQNPTSISSVRFVNEDQAVLAVTCSGTVHQWNRIENSVLNVGDAFPLDSSTNSALSTAISHDGLAIAFADRSCVSLWSVLDRKELSRWPDVDGVNDLEFSSDGRTLAAGQESGNIQLFCTAETPRPNSYYSFTQSHTLRGHSDSVTGVSISSDGKRLVSSSRDGTSILFDVDLGSEILSLNEPSDSRDPEHAHFVANGKTVIQSHSAGFTVFRDRPHVVDTRFRPRSKFSLIYNLDWSSSFDSWTSPLYRWHGFEVSRAMSQHDWCAANFHLEQLLTTNPNDIDLQLFRAINHSLQSDLDSAEVCLQQLLEMDPENTVARSRLALLMLKTGRIPEYQIHCELLCEHAPRTALARAIERALLAIALSPESQISYELQMHLFEDSVRMKSEERKKLSQAFNSLFPHIDPVESSDSARRNPSFPSIPALIAYRHSDYQNAITLARKNTSYNSVDYILCEIIISMSNAKLGKKDTARKWLASAEKRIYDRRERRWTRQNVQYLDIVNIEQAILLDEARNLINSAGK